MGSCCTKPELPSINIKDVCQNIECKSKCLSSCCITTERHHKHKHHKHAVDKPQNESPKVYG